MANTQNASVITLISNDLIASGIIYPSTNVKEGHVSAYLGFTQYSGSAITVDNVSDTDIPDGWSRGANETLVAHDLNVSVRVHTSYINNEKKTATTRTLIDSVIDRVLSKVNLDANYIVMHHNVVGYDVDFTESNTNGGQINFNVRTYLVNTQR